MRRALPASLLALAILVPRPSAGQEAEPAAPESASPEDRVRAREHTQTARQLQRDGRYAEAIVEYGKAYELAPLPDLLFNMAQCHRLRGDSFLAIQFYRRYIAADPDGRGAEEARSHIASLQPELEKTREPDWVGPLPPPPPVDEKPVEAPPPDDRTRRFVHQASLYTMIAGGGVLAAGLVFGLQAESIEDEVQGASVFTPELAERADEGETWHDLMVGAYLTGGVLVVGGALTYFFTRESPDGAGWSLRPRASSRQLGMSLDLRF